MSRPPCTHPPFGSWLASHQRISIRTGLPCIRSFFPVAWLSRHVDVIVPLISWRATKDLRDPHALYTRNVSGNETLSKALHPIKKNTNCIFISRCPLNVDIATYWMRKLFPLRRLIYFNHIRFSSLCSLKSFKQLACIFLILIQLLFFAINLQRYNFVFTFSLMIFISYKYFQCVQCALW